jgi:hypothetical protein
MIDTNDIYQSGTVAAMLVRLISAYRGERLDGALAQRLISEASNVIGL